MAAVVVASSMAAVLRSAVPTWVIAVLVVAGVAAVSDVVWGSAVAVLGDCRVGCGSGCCSVICGVSDVLTYIEAMAAVLVALAAAVTQPLQC